MSDKTVPPQDPPRANPLARFAAVIIGFVLLSVAVVCVREIWLRNSRSIDWDTWVDPIVMTIGNATYHPWMLPAGVALALLGVVLVWLAFRPRSRTHRMLRPAGAAAPVWMRPVDLARMVSAAARAVPGVAGASTHISGGTAQVSVTSHGDDIAPRVDAALQALLTSVGSDLTLRVRQRPVVEEEQ